MPRNHRRGPLFRYRRQDEGAIVLAVRSRIACRSRPQDLPGMPADRQLGVHTSSIWSRVRHAGGNHLVGGTGRRYRQTGAVFAVRYGSIAQATFAPDASTATQASRTRAAKRPGASDTDACQNHRHGGRCIWRKNIIKQSLMTTGVESPATASPDRSHVSSARLRRWWRRLP